MAEYRVGLVGVNRGSGLAYPFTLFPETEITALCDLDEKKLAEAGDFFGVADRFLFTDYDAFLEAPIDTVVVATPIQLHAEQSIKAMQSGKHVLSEVTAAWTIAECKRLVETVKRTRRTYMMAENCCYFHFIRQWKGWMEQGRLGDIFYAEAEYIHDLRHLLWDRESGEAFWRLERPPIYYCSHSLGPLLMLMEDRVVQAMGAHCGYGILPDRGPGCLNMEVALFKTQKGAVIKLLRSQVALRKPRMHYYALYGTRGMIENSRGREWAGKLCVEEEMSSSQRHGGYEVINCPEADPTAPPQALGGGHGSSEYYLVRDFIDAVNAGTRPPIDVIRAVAFTAPGICAHQSAMRGGKWMDVPLFDG